MKNEDIIKIENLKNNKDVFVIRWNMTQLCNYYCDFCIQGNKEKHIKSSINESSKVRAKICDKLIDFIEKELNNKYKLIKVYLIGGEITILKDFIPILNKLVNCKFSSNIEFHITTNMSAKKQIIKKIRKIFKKKENRILSISASYYKVFTKEEQFIKNIDQLQGKNSKYYNINIAIGYPLITDEDYNEYLKFKERNIKYAKSIHYIVIRDYKKSISNNLKNRLPKEDKMNIKVTFKDGNVKFFANIASLALSLEEKQFNPQGFVCDAGINSISINNLGIISRCTSCEKESIVGNIMTDDLKILKNKITCPSIKCNCDYYHIIKKDSKRLTN